MKPTVQVVKDLTEETLKFELGNLIDNITESVYGRLEEDKEFDKNNMSTEEGDIIYHVIIDKVRSEIHKVDELV